MPAASNRLLQADKQDLVWIMDNKAGKVFLIGTQFSKIKDHLPYLPMSRIDTQTLCVGVIHQKMYEQASVPSRCETIAVKRVQEFSLV